VNYFRRSGYKSNNAVVWNMTPCRLTQLVTDVSEDNPVHGFIPRKTLVLIYKPIYISNNAYKSLSL